MEKRIRLLFLFSCIFYYSFTYSNSIIDTVCNQDMSIIISGKVVDTKGNPIENAIVYLDADIIEYPRTRKTDENGYFSFHNNPTGYTYELSVVKDDNHWQNVSTLDYVLMIRHMLGIEEELDNPYKIIAADMNADNKLTFIDLKHHRKLVLGIFGQLPENNSYRFVDASYEFPNPKAPWPDEDNNPYVIKFKPSEDVSFGFIGIKIGDVTI